MRLTLVAVAGALTLAASGALASPLRPIGSDLPALEGSVQQIHHKPGHRGGPPWARNPGRDRSTAYERPAPTVQTCRTTYRTEYDPYEDEYVRRSVRVCS